MTKYKVALGHDLRGISYHRSISRARESLKKVGKPYHIFHYNEPTKFYEGAWRPEV